MPPPPAPSASSPPASPSSLCGGAGGVPGVPGVPPPSTAGGEGSLTGREGEEGEEAGGEDEATTKGSNYTDDNTDNNTEGSVQHSQTDGQTDGKTDQPSPPVHLGFITLPPSPSSPSSPHSSPHSTDPFTCNGYTSWDGGKIGGRPFNLNPSHPLSRTLDSLSCQNCPDQTPLQFLLQIYAPADDVCDQAFHRMMYVFACPNVGCEEVECVRVQVRREEVEGG